MGLQCRNALLGLAALTGAIILWQHSHPWCLWRAYNPTSTSPPRRQHVFQEDIQIGQIESNCGLRETCADDSFPMFLSTGSPEDLWPQLCVSGKFIIQRGVNGGGRGLNAAVIEPSQFQLVSVQNFDTYRIDSTHDLDPWLAQLLDDDILIIFTTDEASTKLNHTSKGMLNSLGSGKIQDVSFRAQWFLITQKGGKGFSTYEKLTFPRTKTWGDKLEFRGCVPRQIPKQLITLDPPLRDLTARDAYCEDKTDEIYQPLCTQTRFQVLMPALLTNRSLIGNMAYSLPSILFAGDSFEIFIAALDSLIHQPGILLSAVTVIHNPQQIDIAGAAKLYNVNSFATVMPKSWEAMQTFAKSYVKKHFSGQKHVIVIDQDTIPSPDFLFFMAQTAPTLVKDSTLSAVSTWSPNCYQESGDVHLAYRVQGDPKYAALLPLEDVEGDIIVPDVSRVQGPEACHMPSLHSDNWIERPQDLSQDRYFHKLVILQQRSQAVNSTHLLASCSSVKFNETTSYVVYFEEDEGTLARILSCLGVLGNQFGRYQRIVRVTTSSKATVLLIGSSSSFYKARPIHS